jgi:hypothetical protein
MTPPRAQPTTRVGRIVVDGLLMLVLAAALFALLAVS